MRMRSNTLPSGVMTGWEVGVNVRAHAPKGSRRLPVPLRAPALPYSDEYSLEEMYILSFPCWCLPMSWCGRVRSCVEYEIVECVRAAGSRDNKKKPARGGTLAKGRKNTRAAPPWNTQSAGHSTKEIIGSWAGWMQEGRAATYSIRRCHFWGAPLPPPPNAVC